MDKAAFGKRMNKVRKERKISADALSEMCGVNPVFIRQIESAARLPSLPILIKICNALEVSPEYLLADSLKQNETDRRDGLQNRIHTLTPKQIDLAAAMIETVIDKMDE